MYFWCMEKFEKSFIFSSKIEEISYQILVCIFLQNQLFNFFTLEVFLQLFLTVLLLSYPEKWFEILVNILVIDDNNIFLCWRKLLKLYESTSMNYILKTSGISCIFPRFSESCQCGNTAKRISINIILNCTGKPILVYT